jgi:hypothetical protein
LLDVYRQTWAREAADVAVQFAAGQDQRTSEGAASRMIDAFIASELSRPAGTIIGIEEDFHINLAEDLPDLGGRVDLLSCADGILTVTDFKTVRSIPTDAAAEEAGEQLILYAQGCQPIAQQLDARLQLRFVYLSKVKGPKVEAMSVTVDRARIERSKAIIRHVFRAMQAAAVYPAPSPLNCVGCPYRRRCRHWHEH